MASVLMLLLNMVNAQPNSVNTPINPVIAQLNSVKQLTDINKELECYESLNNTLVIGIIIINILILSITGK